MFLLSTCCAVWLFDGFCVDDLDDDVVSIEQRSHIESLFVSMFHQTWNLRYYMHIRIISCVSLQSFLLAINLDALSSSNVFRSLIYMFRYKSIYYRFESMNFHFSYCQKKIIIIIHGKSPYICLVQLIEC